MNNPMSKLIIGTANFGSQYGLKNNSVKLSKNNLLKIINHADNIGINTFDTAQEYGDSEVQLGRVLKKYSEIITKIALSPGAVYKKNTVIRSIEKSLERLKTDKLKCILLHRPEVLMDRYCFDILEELTYLKQKGIVNQVGVSIYGSETLEEIIKVFKPDVLQVPFNIFDQRFCLSGWSKRMKQLSTEIHVRSVFLQGLLLMKSSAIPLKFKSKWPGVFKDWFNYQNSLGCEPDEIALGFCLQQPWIDKIVVGIDNSNQLQD